VKIVKRFGGVAFKKLRVRGNKNGVEKKKNGGGQTNCGKRVKKKKRTRTLVNADEK